MFLSVVFISCTKKCNSTVGSHEFCADTTGAFTIDGVQYEGEYQRPTDATIEEDCAGFNAEVTSGTCP